ncbi:Putative auto-transporter adhesin, head GIN domain [Salegentibacter flavus]|uniref:Putative auto-transporter adhesin, head GIN domain n=2 Tax=Salegentibacter flavus TaxID=287099 RepID=A0A1I5A2D2_9FLAO|nr:Putative auto-transporter adhesin, head GIN domain [Salegentibacter flavus]
MKNLIMVFAILFSGTLLSQEEITHQLESFSEVKVYNGLKLNLHYADENKAVVTGEKRGDVQFEIEDGILKVKTNIDNIWKEDNTKVDLYFKFIKNIDARQNSSVELPELYKTEVLNLEASEGAEIYAEIEVQDLSVKSLTGGEVEVKGKAETQDVKIRAGGQYYARYLDSRNISISISAGGVADINASEKVDAKVRAGGTVNVYGNPEIIDKDTLFGGKVNRKN